MGLKRYVLVMGVVLGVWGQAASEPMQDISKMQKTRVVLETEYRIRHGALKMLSEISLFDDVGMVGRSISEQRGGDLLVPPNKGPEGVGISGIGVDVRLVPETGNVFESSPIDQLERDIAELKMAIAKFKNSPNPGNHLKKE